MPINTIGKDRQPLKSMELFHKLISNIILLFHWETTWEIHQSRCFNCETNYFSFVSFKAVMVWIIFLVEKYNIWLTFLVCWIPVKAIKLNKFEWIIGSPLCNPPRMFVEWATRDPQDWLLYWPWKIDSL